VFVRSASDNITSTLQLGFMLTAQQQPLQSSLGLESPLTVQLNVWQRLCCILLLSTHHNNVTCSPYLFILFNFMPAVLPFDAVPLQPFLQTAQTILDNSRSPYAAMLASSSLLRLVTEHALT
jgi:hypothetical protein